MGLSDRNVTVSYDTGTSKFQLKVGGTVIGETADANGVASTMTFTSTDGESTALGSIAGQAGTTTANWTAGDVDTALDYKAPQAAQTPTIVDYNKSTTDIK